MKAYSDYGKESYIIGHTSAPTKDSSVDDKRLKMADNFEDDTEFNSTQIQ